MKRNIFAVSAFIILSSADECGDWSDWSVCSSSCGLGSQSRVYTASASQPSGCQYHGGANQTQACQSQSCPAQAQPTFRSIATEVSDFWCQNVCRADYRGAFPSACQPNPSSPLDQKCAPMDSTNQQALSKAPPTAQATIAADGSIGLGQPTSSSTVQQSNQTAGPKSLTFDCIGSWGSWGSCSSLCGGTQNRTYYIIALANPQGKLCPYQNGETQSQDCPNTCQNGVPQQSATSTTNKFCNSIAPEVSDWWCLKNCIPDPLGNLPVFCSPNPVTPMFQKCACQLPAERKGCWSTSPSVPDSFCSSVCTTITANGDVHPACKPGPFQECRCHFRPLPPILQAPPQVAQGGPATAGSTAQGATGPTPVQAPSQSDQNATSQASTQGAQTAMQGAPGPAAMPQGAPAPAGVVPQAAPLTPATQASQEASNQSQPTAVTKTPPLIPQAKGDQQQQQP